MDSATPVTEPAEEMSMTDKFVNVISAPGDLFTYVAHEGKKSANYTIPLLVSIVMSVIFMFVVFSQQTIKDEMSARQEQSIQKSVEEGKMTQEKADQMRERMPAPGGTIFLVFGSVSVVVFSLILFFGTALVYWLVGKYGFKSPAPYSKVVEVVGLSSYIMVIGTILTMIIVIAMGSINAGPHLGLLVGASFDPLNKMHKLLASINFMTLWYLAVVAIGLTKIFSISQMKAFLTVGILWALFVAVTVSLSFGG